MLTFPTNRFTLHPTLSLPRVASTLPFTYTGADLYALCSDAMLKAITRQAQAVDEKVKSYNSAHSPSNPRSPSQVGHIGLISTAYFFDHLAKEEDTAVVVTEQDFVDAGRELVPSVSVDELKHYERVRKTFEGEGARKQEEQKAIGPALGASANFARPPGSRVPSYDRSKGKGKGKVDSVSPFDGGQADGEAGGKDDSEDDYIIRTDHLKLNGSSRGDGTGFDPAKGKEKAKGKGKAKGSVEIAEGGFGDAAEGDEELYA